MTVTEERVKELAGLVKERRKKIPHEGGLRALDEVISGAKDLAHMAAWEKQKVGARVAEVLTSELVQLFGKRGYSIPSTKPKPRSRHLSTHQHHYDEWEKSREA